MPPKKRGSRASTASRKREDSSVIAQAAEATTDVAEPTPSPATELIEEAAPPIQQQQAEEADDVAYPSPAPTNAVVVATPKTATPTSSNPEVPRDASLRSHHPTVAGVSAPVLTSSSTRSIVSSLDAFLSSPECSGQLIGAWNRMGYCAATQAAILSNMSDSVIAHVSGLVSQQVDTERVEAAKVEMLFDECLLLSQRLQEQVVTASLNEIYHSILSSSSSSPRTTSAAESEENNKTSKKKLVRLVGGVSSDEKAHGTSSAINDADVEVVTVPMPSFACSSVASGSTSGPGCPSAMLSPKQAHASRPTSGNTLPLASVPSTPSFAFLQLSHSKQIEILGNERRRFSRLAEERVEHLRLIYCSKRLLDVPVRRQEKLRAGYARALFDHSIGEDLRAQSSNSSMFFTPTGSPRVTINQVALTTSAVDHYNNNNDIFHQQHIPEVVTAAARAVSRLRSLSVTARAYPFDHPLCATSDGHSNSQPTTDIDATPFIVNDKHCQAILTRGARQDLSMDRVTSEANAVMRTLTKYIRSMVDAMHTESTAIEALEKELGTAAPKTDRGTKVRAAIKEAMETFGVVAGNGSAEVVADEDGIATIYDQQFDNSVLYHQFPECVARLYTIRLPAHALLEASAERERLQMIHYDSTFVKFAEAQHEVWGAYKLYFSATGDQAYASPPDYSDVLNNNKGMNVAPTSVIAEADHDDNEWLERGTAHFGSCKSSDDPTTPIDFNSTLGGDKPVNKASSPVSTPKTLSQQAQLEFETHRGNIARLVEATSKYTNALSTVSARMAVLKEIEPLLKRRDYILHAQSNMHAGSKERLLSRSVNMAKQLREEESLRKMIQKEIPSITAQVVALCDSWEALTRTRMIINAKDVLRVVSGMTNDTNTTATPSRSAANGGGSSGDCSSPRPTQYIYGAEAAAAIGAASTTPGSRLGSPVPGGAKRDAASRSPAPQLPRRQMSSQIPSPSPQPKDRAATPIAVRNMSQVNTAPSVSPRPRSVTPAKSPQTARVTLPPSNENGTATRSSRVAISTPTSTEARAPNQLSRGTSSVVAVSRSLAQPPSRALSRSKAVSPATTRAPPNNPGTYHMQRGTATNPVQHPARSRSPQPKGSAFTRPPPMNNCSSPTSASPRAGGAPSIARVAPGTKRSRSLTPTSTRDGMAPSPLHPSSSVQPRSAAMSRSRQPLQDRQDANSQSTVSMPSTNNKNPSVPAAASSPVSLTSPSAYVPSVFALPTNTSSTDAAEE